MSLLLIMYKMFIHLSSRKVDFSSTGSYSNIFVCFSRNRSATRKIFCIFQVVKKNDKKVGRTGSIYKP